MGHQGTVAGIPLMDEIDQGLHVGVLDKNTEWLIFYDVVNFNPVVCVFRQFVRSIWLQFRLDDGNQPSGFEISYEVRHVEQVGDENRVAAGHCYREPTG